MQKSTSTIDYDSKATNTMLNTPDDYQKEKFVALYQARTILSKHGTMTERQICQKQLKRMRKLGARSVK